MLASNADEGKAGDREDTVSPPTIECAVIIHPEQGRDTSTQQAYPSSQTLLFTTVASSSYP